MPTLSVVLIVKNEEGCIAECLDSVRHIADEIIAADTGSTDSTVAIARRYGASVPFVQWTDDFAAARNEAMSHARGDWIFVIDADEVLDPAGANRIREIVDADGDGYEGICVTQANYTDDHLAFRWKAVNPDDEYSHGFTGYVHVEPMRLFKNGRGTEFRDRIHETAAASILERGSLIRAEPIAIHHYGFSRELDGPKAKGKALNYLRISKIKAQQNPKQAKAWFDLALAAHCCNDIDTALDAARKSVKLDSTCVDAQYRLAALLLEQRDYDEARKVLEATPSDSRLSIHFDGLLGSIAYIQGRFQEAKNYFESVLARRTDQMVSQLFLARTLDQLGDPHAAMLRLEETCSVFPTVPEPLNRLEAIRLRIQGEELFVDGQPKEALREFVKVLQIDAQDPVAHNDAGVALAALGEKSAARSSFERALKLAPTMVSARENMMAV